MYFTLLFEKLLTSSDSIITLRFQASLPPYLGEGERLTFQATMVAKRAFKDLYPPALQVGYKVFNFQSSIQLLKLASPIFVLQISSLNIMTTMQSHCSRLKLVACSKTPTTGTLLEHGYNAMLSVRMCCS